MPTAMRLNPLCLNLSACSAFAANIPAYLPCLAHDAVIWSSAFSMVSCPTWPGMPSDWERSNGPTNAMSIPGQPKIPSRFSSAWRLSIWTATRVSLFASLKYSSMLLLPNSEDLGRATPLMPSGWYLAHLAISWASSGVETCGTTIPETPVSRALKISVLLPLVVLARAVIPRSSAALERFCTVSNVKGPCSMSSMTKSKPASPNISTASGELKLQNMPKACPPDLIFSSVLFFIFFSPVSSNGLVELPVVQCPDAVRKFSGFHLVEAVEKIEHSRVDHVYIMQELRFRDHRLSRASKFRFVVMGKHHVLKQKDCLIGYSEFFTGLLYVGYSLDYVAEQLALPCVFGNYSHFIRFHFFGFCEVMHYYAGVKQITVYFLVY